MNTVEVIAGSRLHFGLLCGAPESGWHYGGIGMMIDQPAWHIHGTRIASDTDEFDVAPVVETRLRDLIGEFRRHYDDLPTVRLTTRSIAGLHAGLGSGTQLTLAVGTAFLMLSGRPRPSRISDLAARLGRSRRSAIGTFGFDHGGFIVDHGRNPSGDERQLRKLTFPEEWRMVVLSPESSEGLSGASEEQFFGERRYLDPAALQQLASLVNSQIVPSVMQTDFEQFRDGLSEYGRLVGEYYSPAQGGVFGNSVIQQIVKQLPSRETAGMVQSSWGPSVAIPARSAAEADEIAARMQALVADDILTARVVRGLNCGATVRTPAPETYRSFG